MQKRVAIYLRVSTSKQDTDNQLRELSAVADRSGWDIWKIYEDAGISGAKGRDKRPGLDAMMKAVNAREFDMVAAWSVDDTGRRDQRRVWLSRSEMPWLQHASDRCARHRAATEGNAGP
jgi:DNA invertase Pin-like site-specific DNA recombinase